MCSSFYVNIPPNSSELQNAIDREERGGDVIILCGRLTRVAGDAVGPEGLQALSHGVAVCCHHSDSLPHSAQSALHGTNQTHISGLNNACGLVGRIGTVSVKMCDVGMCVCVCMCVCATVLD